jgi:hypothetical protein
MALAAQKTIPIFGPAPRLTVRIAGRPYEVTFWDEARWARLDERARPHDARRLDGAGWIEIRKLDPD